MSTPAGPDYPHPDPVAAAEHRDQRDADGWDVDPVTQANSDGYAQGYDDGYADGAAMAQASLDELTANLRLVLSHHADWLRSRDWRTSPRKVLTMYARTVADVRRLVGV